MNPVAWSANLSSTLIEIVKTGIILTDSNGCIRFVNSLALDLFGYTKDFLNGKPVDMLFMPDDKKIFLPNIMKITLDGQGFEGEALLRKNDGSSFFVNLSTALYKGNSNGHHELVIFAVQDITYFKNMKNEYLGAERFTGLGMITDQISHQIRNPIVSIGGFALRLARERVPDEDYLHYTKIIHDESKRLEYIIDRLVEFARFHPTSYSPLKLSEIIKGIMGLFKEYIGNSSINIIFPDPSALSSMPIFGDLPMIIRAVQCVLQNAVEAVRNSGEISVNGDIASNQVFIRVKDNGEGIKSENLPYIFDPFFTTKFNYLGLGLTLAKRIIEEHKGRIDVDSLPGKGTDISIVMPRERRREIRTKLL